MGSLAELSNSVSSLIRAHPALKADLEGLLSQISNLDAPEIGIQIDEGRIQLVERFNDAPFKIYVHEHGVEGAEAPPSELVWNNGKSEPVIMTTYNLLNVFQKWDGPYWYSLRNPTEYLPPHDNDDEALAA